MKTNETLRRTPAEDMALRWTMRIIGLALTMVSLIFMQQDIFTSTLSTWFFGLAAGLGTITALSSWMPGPEKTKLQERPAYQPVPRAPRNLSRR